MDSHEDMDVLLVDDHPLVAAGLCRLLENGGLRVTCSNPASIDELLRDVSSCTPKLIVMDHHIPSIGLTDGAVALLWRQGYRIAMLTGTSDEAALGSLVAAGAAAILLKSQPLAEITEVIRSLLDGAPSVRPALLEHWRQAFIATERKKSEAHAPFSTLSAAEAATLEALAKGSSVAAIAAMRVVSVETIRSQLKSVFRKLGVSSQVEAVALVHQREWLTGDVDAR